MRVRSDEGGDPPCWAHRFVRTDIGDRQDVERFVRDFYRQVAMDDLLGPVFAVAEVDWNAHVANLTDFWAWQLLGERGYDGHPLRAHEPVHARTPFTAAHFARWLELFHSTLDASFEGPVTLLAHGRAEKMAAALGRLLGGFDGPADAPIEPLGRLQRR